MKKLLTSLWGAVALGVILFGATLGVLFLTGKTPTKSSDSAADGTNATPATAEGKTEEPATNAVVETPTPAPAEEEASLFVLPANVADPGTLSFNNPEVAKLLDELREEKEALKRRREELLDLERRIAHEKAYIGSITQKFYEAKALLVQAMTTNQTVVLEKETNKLKQLAAIYTNMVPSNAVAILDKMAVDDIARILEYMKEREKAAILENFVTNDLTKTSRKATEISERLRKLTLAPKLPPEPEATKPK
jgi:flagellar motility protein MotE (MotC chaperone)